MSWQKSTDDWARSHPKAFTCDRVMLMTLCRDDTGEQADSSLSVHLLFFLSSFLCYSGGTVHSAHIYNNVGLKHCEDLCCALALYK